METIKLMSADGNVEHARGLVDPRKLGQLVIRNGRLYQHWGTMPDAQEYCEIDQPYTITEF